VRSIVATEFPARAPLAPARREHRAPLLSSLEKDTAEDEAARSGEVAAGDPCVGPGRRSAMPQRAPRAASIRPTVLSLDIGARGIVPLGGSSRRQRARVSVRNWVIGRQVEPTDLAAWHAK